MDLKKEAALRAITFIQDKSRVGLGAGATMVHLVELLAAERRAGLDISVVTSSFSTRQVLLKNGFVVQPVTDLYELDIYLDGCDQFDRDLNALKSGGGIHTLEKLLASMAKQFLLVGDETKYADQFNDKYPLVIEVLPEACLFVQHRIKKSFPQVRIGMRVSNKKDGAVITEHGNYLLDCWFSSWPQLGELNTNLKAIAGVVETSLFYQLAHKAILAGSNGIKIFERPFK
jgi:ribose 5-phosphate isomerase A